MLLCNMETKHKSNLLKACETALRIFSRNGFMNPEDGMIGLAWYPEEICPLVSAIAQAKDVSEYEVVAEYNSRLFDYFPWKVSS